MVSEPEYCAWRRECGGLKVDRGKRFKELEQNIAPLKQLLADAKLDNAIQQEAAHPTQHFVTGLLDLSVEIV